LEVNNKVKVVANADSLYELYKDSLFVIAPIFKGSGMKTKVAESLMFGKIILATKEAASGYDSVPRDVLIECFDKNKFIEFINKFIANNNNKFNQKSRDIYEEFYSLDAGINRFKKIFSK
jgi:glycosyltransferase involved in cell wall biosynthesis